VIHFNGRAESLLKIAQRLEVVGCAVNRNGTDWLNTAPFENLDAYRRTFRSRPK